MVAEPANGLLGVLVYAAAVLVHPSKVALRGGVALFGRPTEPANGLLVVLIYAAAVLVLQAKVELRGGVALFA